MIYISMTEEELNQLEKHAVYSGEQRELFDTQVLRSLIRLEICELALEKTEVEYNSHDCQGRAGIKK